MYGKVLFTIALVTALLTVVIVRLLFKRLRIKSEMDDIVNLARRWECSEYEIFKRAANKWNFSEKKVEDDFKSYLWYGEIPYYVKDFLKRHS